MTINDSSTDGIVKHYDKLGKLVINDCAQDSYHEFGKVTYAELKDGHVEVEDNASIELVYATTTAVKVTNNGTIDHAHVIGTGDEGKANADTVNGASSGVIFDYNNNTAQNDVDDIYHHVGTDAEIEGTGKKTITNYDVEGAASTLVIEAQFTEDVRTVESIATGVVYNATQDTYYCTTSVESTHTVVSCIDNKDAFSKAISSASAYDTLYLLDDISGVSTSFNLAKSVLINGQNHTITGSVETTSGAIGDSTKGVIKDRYNGIFNVTGANIVVNIKKINVKNNVKSTALTFVNTSTNSKVAISDSTLLGLQYTLLDEQCGDSQELVLNNVTVPQGYNAIYWRGDNGKITATDCDFTSAGEWSGNSNSFATLVISDPAFYENGYGFDCKVENNVMTLNNCTISAVNSGTAHQGCIKVYSPYNNKVYANDCTFTASNDKPYVMLAHADYKEAHYNTSTGKYTSAGTCLSSSLTDETLSHLYINNVLSDDNIDVQIIAHCTVYNNNATTISAYNDCPTIDGTYDSKWFVTMDGGDYGPLYGFKVYTNGTYYKVASTAPEGYTEVTD